MLSRQGWLRGCCPGRCDTPGENQKHQPRPTSCHLLSPGPYACTRVSHNAQRVESGVESRYAAPMKDDLGASRQIPRRDFLQGALVAAATTLSGSLLRAYA